MVVIIIRKTETIAFKSAFKVMVVLIDAWRNYVVRNNIFRSTHHTMCYTIAKKKKGIIRIDI